MAEIQVYPHEEVLCDVHMLRVINHLDLESTGHVVQVVIPDNQYFLEHGNKIPLELAPGEPWIKLITNKSVPISIHFEIARKVVEQTESIFADHGLLLLDRSCRNVYVDLSSGKPSVKHVDMEFVYDRSVGGLRVYDVETSKISCAKSELWTQINRECSFISESVLQALDVHGYRSSEYFSIFEFREKWAKGAQKKHSFEDLTLDLNRLEKILGVSETSWIKNCCLLNYTKLYK